MWLIAAAKNGISSYVLHRAVGVTQKAAWFIPHRIRLSMQTNTFTKKGTDSDRFGDVLGRVSGGRVM